MSVPFSQIELGSAFTSATYTVTVADIDRFADLTGDHNRLHTDDAWVRTHTSYDGRIAHGLLVTSIASGLPTEGIDDWDLLAYLEVTRQMRAPVYPGDTIHQVSIVGETRPSGSRQGAGIVRLDVQVVNEHGQCVQSGTDVLLIAGPDQEAGSDGSS